jgi:hypothetical protein
VLVIELNGDTQVQQYLYRYQTIAEISNNVYDEVESQKLKLFNRGKSHIGRANFHMNEPITQTHQLKQA